METGSEAVEEPGAKSSGSSPGPASINDRPKSVKSTEKSVSAEELEASDDEDRLPTADHPHRVTLTTTLAIAYPKPSDEHSRILDELVKKNKQTIESPKPVHFLHCEYVITPQNGLTQTDVVTYSVAAKVFTDHDSRVVKTWDDGQRVWVAWIHTHEIDITMENAGALQDHVIEVKLWDSKEKMSSRARGDRPKAFRLPSETEIRFPGQGVHGVVSRLSSNWKNLQPKSSSSEGVEDPSLSKLIYDSLDEAKSEKTVAPPLEKEVQIDKKKSSVLSQLAGINASEEDKKRMNELKQQRSGLRRKLSKSTKKSKQPLVKETEKKKAKTNSSRNLPSYGKGKCVSMKLRFENLFGGSQTIAARLDDRSGSVIDGFVTVSTEKSLLPPAAERVFNPMSIYIKSAKDLPNSPIPQTELEKTCKPVYSQYSFLGQPVHQTSGRPHGKHVYFEDNHVIFLGLLDQAIVREFILNNSFQIDVHDRDQTDEQETGEGTIFGVENTDSYMSSVALVSAKRTAYNAFKTVKKAFDPFGVAKVSLLDILRGCTKINTEATVNPCPIPEIIKEPTTSEGESGGLVGLPGAVDRPVRPPTLPGDYLQAGTTLKVHIRLSCPFVPLSMAPQLLPLPKQVCPFARFVLLFDYWNKDLLRRIEHFVTMENARALGLQDFEKSVIDAALSTFKLTREQKHSLTLDIVTGFHVIDGNIHLMVLEGMREGAMQRLLNEVDFSKKREGELLIHLFDTSLTFSHRLYSALDVDLCRVRLHQSLFEIMTQPLLYVRNIIPKECLDCVVKLYEITKLRKLRDVVHGNLFPTSDMVISMSREFGIPLTHEDIDVENEEPSVPEAMETSDQTPGVEMISTEVQAHRNKRLASLDNCNSDFERVLRKRKDQQSNVNHVSANIIAVQETGKRRRPSQPSVRSLQVDGPVHNYSTQTLNSCEMAKSMMRDMLRETDPDGRYAYDSEHMSSMFDHVDVESYYRMKDKEAKDMWRTKEGFVFPGIRSSKEDNKHPLKPVKSRIDDLKYVFRDNVLHRNILKPNLDRERYRWDERKKDLELYKKPTPDFGNQMPHSIMLAGDRKVEEESRFKSEEREEWNRKLTVDDILMRFHRLLWETEDSNRSNQLDRLNQILKDHPIKYSLVKHPAPVLPPLAVVMNPSVDTAARESGKKLPPAFDEEKEKNVGFKPGPYQSRRWIVEANKIPIKNEEHGVFAKKHGHDMHLYHKERSLLSSRVPVKPLTDEEYRTHLFRIPPIDSKADADVQDETVETDREAFGQGPRGRSEYRMMFPDRDVGPRIREVYPRHKLHSFNPLNKDGKPLTRDASIQLEMTDSDLSGNGFTKVQQPVKRGTMLKDEASIELVPQAALPIKSVQVV